jgi:hypothetical protein
MSQPSNVVAKISTAFAKLSDAAFSSKGLTIYTSMLTNAYYPTPVPDMPTISAALQAYTNALVAAQTKERTAVQLKNQARAALTANLKLLGVYVTLTANGDAAKLASSGYDMAKSRSPKPPITKPENLIVTMGKNSGELDVSVDRVANARSYAYQYNTSTPTDDSAWETEISTSRKYTLTGLISGTKYTCRVGAVGSKNQTVYSDTVTRIVQ